MRPAVTHLRRHPGAKAPPEDPAWQRLVMPAAGPAQAAVPGTSLCESPGTRIALQPGRRAGAGRGGQIECAERGHPHGAGGVPQRKIIGP
jgi:hypothetical protein